MATRAYKQDLPPKGGYAPISFKRIPARKLFSGPTLFAGAVAYHILAVVRYKYKMRERERDKVEERSSELALEPLLLAERDREFLRQVKINRDEEEDLMKDVENWTVGTWYGIPVYKTVPDSMLPFYYSANKWRWEWNAHTKPRVHKGETNHYHWVFN